MPDLACEPGLAASGEPGLAASGPPGADVPAAGAASRPAIGAPAAASLACLPLREARAVLAELTRAHLLAEQTPGRFAFHGLLRAYAAEQAQAHDGGPSATRPSTRCSTTTCTPPARRRCARHPGRPAPPRRQPDPGQAHRPRRRRQYLTCSLPLPGWAARLSPAGRPAPPSPAGLRHPRRAACCVLPSGREGLQRVPGGIQAVRRARPAPRSRRIRDPRPGGRPGPGAAAGTCRSSRRSRRWWSCPRPGPPPPPRPHPAAGRG